jgi:hypothetical protein
VSLVHYLKSPSLLIYFSIWMNEAQMAIQVRLGHGTQAGENPALRVLFYRLCRLLTLPIIPIFVFDGPDRPKVKRGINVKTTKPHWLSTPLKKFIDAFSFFWYTVSISTCHLDLFLVILLFYRLPRKRKLTSLN